MGAALRAISKLPSVKVKAATVKFATDEEIAASAAATTDNRRAEALRRVTQIIEKDKSNG